MEEAAEVTKFTKPICSTCGSDDIVVDAYARWNPVTQQFELDGDTSTTSLCGKCGGETSIRNIPLAGRTKAAQDKKHETRSN
jgi:ribosomal protein S27AE